ncbi:MFS transporter [Lactiplantibacillus paraplantarum]|uniref:MFS transporter n=1 Tax=Lactiplantibacillus paraplantarum TaxID=60520 RepID=UPI00207337B7|nr:MFS transporter [Lactiplantibacillus paraplantarum]
MLSPITRRNLYLSYGYAACAFFGITTLWVIFLQQQGLSLVEIGLCESVFHLTSFLSEVPSGILADRFGYRSVLVGSRLMAIGHAIIMLTAHSLTWFIVAFILQAWAYNLQSGTIAAAQYDSLVTDQATQHYPRVTTTLNTTIELADTIGVVLAGWFLPNHLITTYWLYLIVAAIAIVTASWLHVSHTPSATSSAEQPTLHQILIAAGHLLIAQPRLRTLMVFDALFSALGTTYYYYFQTVMTAHHFSGVLITTVLISGMILNILAIQITPWLQRHQTQRQLLVKLCLGLVIALLSTFGHAIGLLVIIYLVINSLMAMIEPLFSNYYNQLISNGQRATLLSVASMAFSLAMVGSFPLIGWLIQMVGFTVTFGSCGLLTLMALLGIYRYEFHTVN